MAVICWELGCKHYNLKNTCRFFSFPINQVDRRKWLSNLKRKGEPPSWARLCSCHFLDRKKENGPSEIREDEANVPQLRRQSRLEPSEIYHLKYGCSQCSYQAAFLFQLNHHIQRAHINVYPLDLCRDPLELGQFPCDYKSALHHFDSYEHCKHTQNLQSNNTGCDNELTSFRDQETDSKYSCDYCKFDSYSSLFVAKHSCKTQFETEVVSLMACSYSSDRSDQAGTHRFQCSHCSFRAKFKSRLKRHALKHVTEEDVNCWFQCGHCRFRTRYRSALARHLLRVKHAAHDESMRFMCNHCSYRAKYMSVLKRHTLKHAADEEIDWFQCEHCSFLTRYKSALKRHLVKHATGDEINWFKCHQCSYQARVKSYLKEHLAVVHGRRTGEGNSPRFQCRYCSYRSEEKINLTRHVINHGINWFQCSHCSFRTKQKSCFKRHVLEHAAAGEAPDWFE